MQVVIQPKAAFVKDPQVQAAHRAIVDSPQFAISAMTVMAQLAIDNVSQEQLRGANLFLSTFLNLAEPEPTSQAQFPHKPLIQ